MNVWKLTFLLSEEQFRLVTYYLIDSYTNLELKSNNCWHKNNLIEWSFFLSGLDNNGASAKQVITG